MIPWDISRGSVLLAILMAASGCSSCKDERPLDSGPADTTAPDPLDTQPASVPVTEDLSAERAERFLCEGVAGQEEVMALPLELTTRFSVEAEHSCSRSYADKGARGSITLEVTEDGEATLTLSSMLQEGYGPSRGAFREGERGFHSSLEKEERILAGRGKVEGSILSLSFEESRVRSVHSVTEELPEEATKSDIQVSLSCTYGCLEMFPPVVKGRYFWDDEGQEATRSRVLVCVVEGGIFKHDELLLQSGALLFAPEGLEILHQKGTGFSRNKNQMVFRPPGYEPVDHVP